MLALWRFIAGDSRIAPLGIAIAFVFGVAGTRLGWGSLPTALAFTGTLVVTLVSASWER